MGQLCSSLVKGEAQGPSFVSILAQADIQAVHRALEAEPHKVRKHLSGKLGTPLHVAAAHGRTQCVELLMQQALALAVGPGMEDATVVISSEDSSDVVWSMVNSGNNRRQTPLMLAAAAGHEECALLLLERVRHAAGPCLSCTTRSHRIVPEGSAMRDHSAPVAARGQERQQACS
jgi:ankyrin repeat protein